jgi:hypothetical protein
MVCINVAASYACSGLDKALAGTSAQRSTQACFISDRAPTQNSHADFSAFFPPPWRRLQGKFCKIEAGQSVPASAALANAETGENVWVRAAPEVSALASQPCRENEEAPHGGDGAPSKSSGGLKVIAGEGYHLSRHTTLSGNGNPRQINFSSRGRLPPAPRVAFDLTTSLAAKGCCRC